MFDRSRSTAFSVALATGTAMPGPLIAENDFGGIWQPYSAPAARHGTLTVASDQLSFEAGPTAQLEPVRAAGSIFRLATLQGDPLEGCGPDPVTYVGFQVLENGLMALLYYGSKDPPAEPTGTDSISVTRNGACSVVTARL